jgi:hypothetical protein
MKNNQRFFALSVDESGSASLLQIRIKKFRSMPHHISTNIGMLLGI